MHRCVSLKSFAVPLSRLVHCRIKAFLHERSISESECGQESPRQHPQKSIKARFCTMIHSHEIEWLFVGILKESSGSISTEPRHTQDNSNHGSKNGLMRKLEGLSILLDPW
jgi:hypothetical protein